MEEQFYEDLITKLYSSVSNLEKAIEGTSSTLSNHPISTRVDEYKRMVATQRRYVDELVLAIRSQQYEEIARLIGIVNGISKMVRDDATQVISTMGQGKPEWFPDELPEEEPYN